MKETPVIVLYDSHRKFMAHLDAAIGNASNDNERAWLGEIDMRYEEQGDFALLSDDEHDLIERLAAARTTIGPTDV